MSSSDGTPTSSGGAGAWVCSFTASSPIGGVESVDRAPAPSACTSSSTPRFPGCRWLSSRSDMSSPPSGCIHLPARAATQRGEGSAPDACSAPRSARRLRYRAPMPFTKESREVGDLVGPGDGVHRLIVLVQAVAPDEVVYLHRHDGGDQILRVVSGEVLVEGEGEPRRCVAGEIAVVPAGAPHGFAGTGEPALLE